MRLEEAIDFLAQGYRIKRKSKGYWCYLKPYKKSLHSGMVTSLRTSPSGATHYPTLQDYEADDWEVMETEMSKSGLVEPGLYVIILNTYRDHPDNLHYPLGYEELMGIPEEIEIEL